MFTNKTIKASSLTNKLSLNVKIDFDFSFCGKIDLDLPNMLVPAESEKYVKDALSNPQIVGVVCLPELEDLVEKGLGIITSDNPRECLNDIQDHISTLKDFQWKDFKSKIDSSAVIHSTAWVAQENVIIGKDVKIGPNAVVCERSIIENDVKIGSGSIIGEDAFESNITKDGLKDFGQSGGVLLKKGSRLLANVTVAKSAYGGFTEIGENSYLDNLVHIAHDCILGKNVKFTACSITGGRVKVGDNTQIGLNATILNGLEIGKDCNVSLGAVVTKNIPDGQKVTGNFAINHNDFINNLRKTRESN